MDRTEINRVSDASAWSVCRLASSLNGDRDNGQFPLNAPAIWLTGSDQISFALAAIRAAFYAGRLRPTLTRDVHLNAGGIVRTNVASDMRKAGAYQWALGD